MKRLFTALLIALSGLTTAFAGEIVVVRDEASFLVALETFEHGSPGALVLRLSYYSEISRSSKNRFRGLIAQAKEKLILVALYDVPVRIVLATELLGMTIPKNWCGNESTWVIKWGHYEDCGDDAHSRSTSLLEVEQNLPLLLKAITDHVK